MGQKQQDKLLAELQQYRKQIDRIDDALLELLIERFSVVKKVGEFKQRVSSPHQSFIRPGREASMIRRVIEKSPPELPKALFAQIWRLIIACSVHVEERPSVSVLSTLENKECFWLAREYFGSFASTTTHPTAPEILQDVIERRATIGVLPLLDDGISHPWWMRLKEADPHPHIFARLPFVEMAPSKKSPIIAIGYVPMEASGDDHTIIVLSVSEQIADAAVHQALKECRLPAEVRSSTRQVGIPSSRHYLIEISEFLEETDPRFKKLCRILDAATPARVTMIGTFAVPIRFYDEETDST